jgi:glutamine amidotransferase
MIGIVDYEAGNIRSVTNALTTIETEFIVSGKPEILCGCSGIILPGVGAAPGAMRSLQRGGLAQFLTTVTVPFLGICLGMQILFDHSDEGDTDCLGVIPGNISALPEEKVKIPHIGWNEVIRLLPSPLWDEIPDNSYFYFANSYVASPGDGAIAVTDCGVTFTAAVQSGNFFGVQFHPEKSGSAGLTLLKNFVRLCR